MFKDVLKNKWIMILFFVLLFVGKYGQVVYADVDKDSVAISNLPGDADNNGLITISDAQLILKAALRIDLFDSNGKQIFVRNISENTLANAQLVLKASLKIISLDDLEVMRPYIDNISNVSTGSSVEIPTGPAIEIPTNPAIEVPTEDAVEVTPVAIDYAQIYIETIDSYKLTYFVDGLYFMAINTDAMVGCSDEDKKAVITYFENQGYRVIPATKEQLIEQGLVKNPNSSSERIIDGVYIQCSKIEVEKDRIVVFGSELYSALSSKIYETIFEVEDGVWKLVSSNVIGVS